MFHQCLTSFEKRRPLDGALFPDTSPSAGGKKSGEAELLTVDGDGRRASRGLLLNSAARWHGLPVLGIDRGRMKVDGPGSSWTTRSFIQA